MKNDIGLAPIVPIETLILRIRGQRVILDTDLAHIYGVTTRRLNEQVKRNAERFPPHFMFRLTAEEKGEVVAICDRLHRMKYATVHPAAFTEHGAIMAAAVLNSPRAIQVSIFVVEAFIRLREVVRSNRALALKLDALEKKVASHDAGIQALFEALRRLLTLPEKERKPIGFHVKESHSPYAVQRRGKTKR